MTLSHHEKWLSGDDESESHGGCMAVSYVE